MHQIHTKLGEKSYTIYISRDLLNHIKSWINKNYPDHKLYIISNETIKNLYPAIFNNDFKNINHYLIPDGEFAKSWDVADKIFEDLIKKRYQRKTLIIALGGGVVGDLTGFIAATYMRSVPFIQIPTTLLSQVDSSVGGKVAINHRLGKNLIGAFYQPKAVFIDSKFLLTLPKEELCCGFAEVVKYGYISDAAFLGELKVNTENVYKKDLDFLEKVICRSVEIKKNVVEQDEEESGLRAILNFGHTFGHGVEAAYHYAGIKHGEAVFTGMKAALFFSVKALGLSCSLDEELSFINEQYRFLNEKKIKPEEILSLMAFDKKNESEKINLILLDRIGNAVKKTVTDHNLLKESVEYMFNK